MGEQGHAAVMIKFSHEGPQSGHVPGHLPCPVGMAIRPGLPGRSVLDPVVEKKPSVAMGREHYDGCIRQWHLEELRQIVAGLRSTAR